MALSRTFEQAADTLLTRYDRAAAQLREVLAVPFTSGCDGSKSVEQSTEKLLDVVRDVVALRSVEARDATLAKNTAARPAPAARETLSVADLGIFPGPAEPKTLPDRVRELIDECPEGDCPVEVRRDVSRDDLFDEVIGYLADNKPTRAVVVNWVNYYVRPRLGL